jgi:RNA polymerase sigma factor (sigma-70 family)
MLEAFEVLDGLRGVIRSKIRGVEAKIDIDDVMQDAAIAILTGYGAAPRTKAVWTAKSARRKCWRDSRRDHERLVNGGNPNQEITSDPLAAMIRGEEIEALEAGFARMDPNIEMAVKMRFYEDLTFEQIAKAFGVSNPTAAAMVKRGLIALREAIGE